MSSINNVTRAAVVLLGLQDTTCFTSMQEFIDALPNLIGVEVPNNITNVIVSNVQPSDSQTTDVWFRLSNSGSFISINVFSAGAWRTIYPVNTDDTLQIFYLQGDPANPPPGFLSTTDAPGVDPVIAAALEATWIAGTSPTMAYTAIFVGF